MGCEASLKAAEPGGPPASTGLTVNIAPLVYRALVHDGLVRAKWQGEELILWKATGVVRLDATTGAARDHRSAKAATSTGSRWFLAPSAPAEINWRSPPRLGARFLIPARRLGSSVEFLCAGLSRCLVVSCRKFDEAKQNSLRRWETHLALAGRLAGLGLLDPIEAWWFAPRDTKHKSFMIPSEDEEMFGGLTGSALTAVKDAADEPGTEVKWPAFMLQQTCSLLSGQRAAAGTTAREICERLDFGPLACCVGAMLLAKNHSDLSEEMATIGLQRLDRESYLRNCQNALRPGASDWRRQSLLVRCAGTVDTSRDWSDRLVPGRKRDAASLRRPFSVTPQRRILRWRPPARCGTNGFTSI